MFRLKTHYNRHIVQGLSLMPIRFHKAEQDPHQVFFESPAVRVCSLQPALWQPNHEFEPLNCSLCGTWGICFSRFDWEFVGNLNQIGQIVDSKVGKQAMRHPILQAHSILRRAIAKAATTEIGTWSGKLVRNIPKPEGLSVKVLNILIH